MSDTQTYFILLAMLHAYQTLVYCWPTSKHNKRHVRHVDLLYIAGHAPLQNIIKDISDT